MNNKIRKRSKGYLSLLLSFLMVLSSFSPLGRGTPLADPLIAFANETNIDSSKEQSGQGTALSGWTWVRSGARVTLAKNSGGTVDTVDFFSQAIGAVDMYVNSNKLDYVDGSTSVSFTNASGYTGTPYDYDVLDGLPTTVEGSQTHLDTSKVIEYFSLENNIDFILREMEQTTIADKIKMGDEATCKEYYLMIEPIVYMNLPSEEDAKVVMSASDALAYSLSHGNILNSKMPSLMKNFPQGIKLADEDEKTGLAPEGFNGTTNTTEQTAALQNGYGVAIVRFSSDFKFTLTAYIDKNMNHQYDSGDTVIVSKPLWSYAYKNFGGKDIGEFVFMNII